MKNTEIQAEKRYLASAQSSNRSDFYFMGVERKTCPSNYGALPDGTLTVWPFEFNFEWQDGALVGFNDNDSSRYIITEAEPSSEKAAAMAKRRLALEKIEKAQTLLYEATQAVCPLQGWADLWTELGDHADATKRLWHKLNDAPRPVGHDGF